MQPEFNQPQPMPVNSNPKRGRAKKALLAILVVVLLVGLSVGTWWYGSSQAEKKSDEKIANLQSQINDLKKEKSEVTEGQKEEADYLIVKQWGVKLKPTNASMSYKVERLGDEEVLQLTNADVAKLGDSCNAETYLATVLRYTTRQTDAENSEAWQGGEYISKVGNYHYYVVGANGTCSENPNELKIRNDIVAAAKTLIAQ